MTWRAQDYDPRYNVAPGTAILAFVHGSDNQAAAEVVDWGLKTPRTLLINARAESVTTRPTFRPLLANGRCVIPMNGYFEWHHATRQPYYLYPATGAPAWALGLYRVGLPRPAAVILTRPAAASVDAIHARMPLLASREEAETWLWRSGPDWLEVLPRLLATNPDLGFHQVATTVNNARHQGPDLIRAIAGLP